MKVFRILLAVLALTVVFSSAACTGDLSGPPVDEEGVTASEPQYPEPPKE